MKLDIDNAVERQRLICDDKDPEGTYVESDTIKDDSFIAAGNEECLPGPFVTSLLHDLPYLSFQRPV